MDDEFESPKIGVETIELDYIGIKGHQSYDNAMSVEVPTLIYKDGDTERIIECRIKLNKTGHKMRYSRNTRKLSREFRKFGNLPKYVSDDEHSKIYDTVDKKYIKNEKVMKLMRKAYKICFNDKDEIDISDRRYIEAKEKFREHINSLNTEIRHNNTKIIKEMERAQEKCLEQLEEMYNIAVGETFQTDGAIEPFFDNGSINLWYIHEEMLEQMEALIQSRIQMSLAYVCKDKSTDLPVSILLIGEYSNDDNDIKLHCQYITAGTTTFKNLKVCVIRHSKITPIAHSEEFNIEGIEDYTLYNIEDTPLEYRNIVLCILNFDIGNECELSNTGYDNKELKIRPNWTNIEGLFGLKETSTVIAYYDSIKADERYKDYISDYVYDYIWEN